MQCKNKYAAGLQGLYRYDWYQNDFTVIVDVFVKDITESLLKVNFTRNQVSKHCCMN